MSDRRQIADLRLPGKTVMPEREAQDLERRINFQQSLPAGTAVELPAVIRGPRTGNLQVPYVRKDGTQTRAATIHFLCEVHDGLRVEAARSRRSIADIVNEVTAQWLLDRER